MIISASRRTDIPAFYSNWFMNRVREGCVMVRNPLFNNRINHISLKNTDVDAIVFWTKNPQPIIKHLSELNDKGYFYYFLYTLNPYGKNYEPNIPDTSFLINTFHQLSSLVGKERIIWRYDPIILTDETDENYHVKNFYNLALTLQGKTSKCITSFMVTYKKCIRNMRDVKIENIDTAKKVRILKSLNEIANCFGISLQVCADEEKTQGIENSCCINTNLINSLNAKQLKYKKDKGQRINCQCTESIDIGAYNTCRHGCLYCYANYDCNKVEATVLYHNPNSPLMIGELDINSKIRTV